MKTLLFAILLSISGISNAKDAVWTMKFDIYDNTGTVWKWDCQYEYKGRFFWRIYENYCPNEIGVND